MSDWFATFDDGEEATWAAPWTRRAALVAALALVAATWKLWTPQIDFPQVPLLAAAGELPAVVNWLFLAGFVAALLVGLGPEKHWTTTFALYSIPLGWLALACGDQQRLVPWAWQISLLAIAFAAGDARRGLQLARLLTVGIYFHSALSKFDASFLDGPGTNFAAVFAAPLGIDAAAWRLAWLLPIGELAVAVGLALPAAWRWARGAALVGAVLMHLTLLAILGPWGLGHQMGVLLWNIAFLALDLLLFGPALWMATASIPPTNDEVENRADEGMEPAAPFVTNLAWTAVLVALLWPFLASWGFCDPWFAWELYSPRAARAEIFIAATGVNHVPPEWLDGGALAAGETWIPLRPDRVSLNRLGSPLYPHPRVQLGVALAVVERYDLGPFLRVDLLGPADRQTGRRTRQPLHGLPSLRAAAARIYWVNYQANPWP